MILQEIKYFIATDTYAIIENTNKKPLLHGYSDWWESKGLNEKQIVSLYVKKNILYIMIK